MKNKHFSMPGKEHGPKHHHGHPHGHPTKTGLGGDSGNNTDAEFGLSAGNERAPRKALSGNSLPTELKEHHLQHVDYGELTGSNYNEPHK